MRCQAVFLPGVFAACVAMLLADSVDALEMIMNTLAVTFLLEIDDIMYKVVLTDCVPWRRFHVARVCKRFFPNGGSSFGPETNSSTLFLTQSFLPL